MQLLLGAAEASSLVTDVYEEHGTMVCTLAFTELSGRVALDDGDGDVRGLRLEGQLPAGPGRVTLTPERGLAGAVAALREIELGDALIDDAWVVRGDGPALLLALAPPLRALAPHAPTVTVDGEVLRVSFGAPITRAELGTRLHEAFALWERATSYRQGAA
ncbi:MAG: hypothetical protein IT383_24140 [Deltaproteobacteria bacterium]|nr:hypothetical protein [Deltaproteobacteria bacterium]